MQWHTDELVEFRVCLDDWLDDLDALRQNWLFASFRTWLYRLNICRETWPAIDMITSSPAPDSASSVTQGVAIIVQRPPFFVMARISVHTGLKDVTGRRSHSR